MACGLYFAKSCSREWKHLGLTFRTSDAGLCPNVWGQKYPIWTLPNSGGKRWAGVRFSLLVKGGEKEEKKGKRRHGKQMSKNLSIPAASIPRSPSLCFRFSWMT